MTDQPPTYRVEPGPAARPSDYLTAVRHRIDQLAGAERAEALEHVTAIEGLLAGYRAALGATQPPVDRAALRDRIAEALAVADGWEYADGLGFRDMGDAFRERYLAFADAVLALLPPPADRAAILRELADQQEQTAATDVIRRRRSIATARRLFAAELRRMADEARQDGAQP